MSDIAKEIKEFNKRWKISDDSSYEEEFKKFRTRTLNIFRDIDDHISKEGIKKFCQILGIPEEWREGSLDYLYSENIINALESEDYEIKFYRLLQIIFYLPIQTSYGYGNHITYSRENLLNQLTEAIELSKINLSITIKGEDVILYPCGEKKFDQVLVEETLIFLTGKSQEHFIESLKLYETRNPKDTIKSAESLRRALEEFLRLKLNNNWGLDKNIPELQKKLKDKGRDPVIRNVIFQIFSYLDQYFNENSKHQDGDINGEENEYLIYQTGILMRYIDKALK